MKLTFSAAFLALFLATPAFALQEPDKDKPPQQEEPKKEEPKKQEPDRQQPQEKEPENSAIPISSRSVLTSVIPAYTKSRESATRC